MKKIVHLTAAAILLTCAQKASAQAGQWKLAGNTLTGNEKLGSTNGFPVKMIANNSTLMTLRPNGRIGFGTTTPTTKFHFQGLVRIDDSIGTSLLPLMILNGGSNNATIELRTNDTLKTIFGYDQSGNSFNINVASPYISSIAVNRGTGDVLVGSHQMPASKIDLANNTSVSGDLKVVATNGLGDLFFNYYQQSIRFPTFGATAQNSAMIFMTDQPTTNARMVLAHSKAFSNWGLQYDDNNDQFNFLGSGANKMAVNLQTGRVGINNAAPAYSLDVSGTSRFFGNVGIQTAPNTRTLQIGNTQGALIGIGTAEYLQDAGTNLLWSSASIASATDNTFSLGNSTNRWAAVWATDGTINTSDARDKTNIRNLNYGLKEIMKLHAVKYNWKNNQQEGDKLGVLAQEIQKVLPEVVRDYDYVVDETTGKKTKVATDRLGVMYSDIIPVLINGMQEQQKQIEDLKAMVQQLTGTSAQSLSNNNQQVTLNNAENASLLQNKPNPVQGNTSISYKAAGKNLQLLFADASGKTIKQIQLSGAEGNISVDCSNLTAGSYTYTLIADGKIIDSKKMIVSK